MALALSVNAKVKCYKVSRILGYHEENCAYNFLIFRSRSHVY